MTRKDFVAELVSVLVLNFGASRNSLFRRLLHYWKTYTVGNSKMIGLKAAGSSRR